MDDADKRPTILIVAGPTAVGKSGVGMAVARALGGEIISADSAAVFQGLDIGTAKPPLADQKAIPHHGLDVVKPTASFSVADFQKLAEYAVSDILARGRLPIIVGGTGLWIRALVRGYDLPQQAGPSPLRIRIHDAAERDNFQSLRRQLSVVDSASFRAIDPHDHRRLVRAMEVFMTTGRPLHRSSGGAAPYRAVYWVLTRNVHELHARIAQRVQLMLEAGLAAEAMNLIRAGVRPGSQSLSAIGYREMVDWIYGRTTEAERDALIVKHTQQLAKRQLTWFRGEPEARWLDLSAWPMQAAVAKIAGSLSLAGKDL